MYDRLRLFPFPEPALAAVLEIRDQPLSREKKVLALFLREVASSPQHRPMARTGDSSSSQKVRPSRFDLMSLGRVKTSVMAETDVTYCPAGRKWFRFARCGRARREIARPRSLIG